MNAYLAVKTLHILSAAVLFGTGMGIAWFMLMAHRTRDLAAIRTTCRHVVVADWCFTAPAVVVQPLSGLWLMHAAGHAFDGGFKLFLGLIGTRANGAENERAHARGVFQAILQRRRRAHGHARDMSRGDVQAIENGAYVGGRVVLRIGIDGGRHVGRRITAGVVNDAAVLALQRRDLGAERTVRARQFVHEHDGRTRAGAFVIEFGSVRGGDMRHEGSLL